MVVTCSPRTTDYFAIRRQCTHAAFIKFSLASGVRNAECADSVYVGQLGQRVIRRQRLGVEDIEAGVAELAGLQRVDHRFLVDNGAARGVDQDRAWLHRLEAGARHHSAGLVVEQQVDRDHVAFGQQFLVFDEFDLRKFLRRPIPGDHAHAAAESRSAPLRPRCRRSRSGRASCRSVACRRRAASCRRGCRGPSSPSHAGGFPHQRDCAFGDRGIAIALDQVHGDAELGQVLPDSCSCARRLPRNTTCLSPVLHCLAMSVGNAV